MSIHNHTMKLSSIPFEKIRKGTKVIESRLFDDKRREISVGDTIEFIRTDDPAQRVVRKVSCLHLYPSFKAMFQDLPHELFGGDSPDSLLEEISQFYNTEEQTKYGVVGIRLE